MHNVNVEKIVKSKGFIVLKKKKRFECTRWKKKLCKLSCFWFALFVALIDSGMRSEWWSCCCWDGSVFGEINVRQWEVPLFTPIDIRIGCVSEHRYHLLFFSVPFRVRVSVYQFCVESQGNQARSIQFYQCARNNMSVKLLSTLCYLLKETCV